MAIKPLEDRVVIKIEQAEQTTASGLVIPPKLRRKSRRKHALSPLARAAWMRRATAFP